MRTSTLESREPLRLSGAILFGGEAVEKLRLLSTAWHPGSNQVLIRLASGNAHRTMKCVRRLSLILVRGRSADICRVFHDG
jgi:hypothetical protein